MLTRVQISNINAIDYCDINFQKAKYKYLDNMIYQDKLVNPIAFYGSNGSGKSSFLQAVLDVLRLMILEPQQLLPFSTNRFVVTKKIRNFTQKAVTKTEIDQEFDSITSFVKLFFEINTDL